MNFKLKKILGIIFKTLSIGFAVSGILLSYFVPWGKGYMSGIRTFLYFTTLSNLFISILFIFGIIFDVLDLKSQILPVRRTYSALNQICTTAMTITWLSYFGMFITFIASNEMASGWAFISFPSNWTVHLAAPICVLLNYFLTETPTEKRDYKTISLLCLIFPFMYLIGTYILSFNGVMFGDGGQIVPYFFMDYQTIPPFILVLIYIAMSFAIYFLSILMLKLQNKIDNKHK